MQSFESADRPPLQRYICCQVERLEVLQFIPEDLEQQTTLYGGLGEYKDEIPLHQKVVEIRSLLLGKHHPSTLIAMFDLAKTVKHEGRWKETVELLERMVKIREQLFGREHLDTILAKNTLAWAYRHQGRWRYELEKELKKVLEWRISECGESHFSTIKIKNDLANVFKKQQKWKDEVALREDIHKIWVHLSRITHPDTLTVLNHLA